MRPQPRRRHRYSITDFLFWMMMLLINIPEVLTLRGIETMFKPYRVLSLILAVIAVPTILREARSTRQFTGPLVIAVAYALMVTVLFGGEELFANIPLLATVLALYCSTYAVTSPRSIIIGLYCFIVSFLISGYFGFTNFRAGQYRLSGLFENPNTFGYGGCFVLILLWNQYFPLKGYLRWGLAALTVPLLILTGSRGTLLAMTGGFASQTWRNPKLFLITAMLGIVLVLVSPLLMESMELSGRSVFTRLTDAEVLERGRMGRVGLIMAGLQVGAESGFVGIGLGQYRLKHHTRFFQRRGLDGEISQLNLHNIYLSILVEWGFVGFICFAIFVQRLVRAVSHLQFEKDLVYGFLGVSLVNGIGNDLISEIHFWIFLGICVQLVRFAPPRPVAPSPRIKSKAVAAT